MFILEDHTTGGTEAQGHGQLLFTARGQTLHQRPSTPETHWTPPVVQGVEAMPDGRVLVFRDEPDTTRLVIFSATDEMMPTVVLPGKIRHCGRSGNELYFTASGHQHPAKIFRINLQTLAISVIHLDEYALWHGGQFRQDSGRVPSFVAADRFLLIPLYASGLRLDLQTGQLTELWKNESVTACFASNFYAAVVQTREGLQVFPANPITSPVENQP